MIIAHGWPGSVFELLASIAPLANPTAHGGKAEDAFDVVIPSLPGYGFSAVPRTTGWDSRRIAKAWDTCSSPSRPRSRMGCRPVTRRRRISAARLYWEEGRANFNRPVNVPAAFTVFPGESFRAPKRWVQHTFPNLIYFNEVDRGGHFAAWEQPELFATEVRAAFRPLRQGKSTR